MSGHLVPPSTRARRSGLPGVFRLLATLGAIVALVAVSMGAVDVDAHLASTPVDPQESTPGTVIPEPSAPGVPDGGASPLTIGFVVVVSALATGVAGYVFVSRRSRPR